MSTFIKHLILLVFIVPLFEVHSASGKSCSALLRLARKTVMAPLVVTKESALTAFYPALGIARGAESGLHLIRREPWQAGQSLRKNMRRDRWRQLGFAGLAATYLLGGTSLYRFHKETEEFDERELEDDEIMIVVDAFKKDDAWYANGGKSFYKKFHKNNPKVFLVDDVQDWGDLKDKLQELSFRHGKIAKLEFFSHGLPGVALPGESEQLDLYAVDEFPTALKKGAVIRFNSCFIGNNDKDLQVFHELFSKKFAPLGAKIFYARQQIVPNVVELASFHGNTSRPPDWIRAAGEPFSVGLAPVFAVGYCHIGHGERGFEGPFLMKKSVQRSAESRKGIEKIDSIASSKLHQIFSAKKEQLRYFVKLYNGIIDSQVYANEYVDYLQDRQQKEYGTALSEDDDTNARGVSFYKHLGSYMSLYPFTLGRDIITGKETLLDDRPEFVRHAKAYKEQVYEILELKQMTGSENLPSYYCSSSGTLTLPSEFLQKNLQMLLQQTLLDFRLQREKEANRYFRYLLHDIDSDRILSEEREKTDALIEQYMLQLEDYAEDLLKAEPGSSKI